MLAKGAGAEMRRTLGTAVFSGMLGVTLFGIFLTPVFFSPSIGWVARRCLLRRAIALRLAAIRCELLHAGAAMRHRVVSSPPRRRMNRDSVRAENSGRKPAPRTPPARRYRPPSRRRGYRRLKEYGTVCFPRFSSIGRSSPRCCRSSSRWPAAWRCSRCRLRSIRRLRRPRSKFRRSIPARTPKWWPIPSPRRSSSKWSAWKTCCTCRRNAPTTATTCSRSRSTTASI